MERERREPQPGRGRARPIGRGGGDTADTAHRRQIGSRRSHRSGDSGRKKKRVTPFKKTSEKDGRKKRKERMRRTAGSTANRDPNPSLQNMDATEDGETTDDEPIVESGASTAASGAAQGSSGDTAAEDGGGEERGEERDAAGENNSPTPNASEARHQTGDGAALRGGDSVRVADKGQGMSTDLHSGASGSIPGGNSNPESLESSASSSGGGKTQGQNSSDRRLARGSHGQTSRWSTMKQLRTCRSVRVRSSVYCCLRSGV